ncbi:hypothetical protein ACET3Z_027939 [Daucus carota]
MGKATRWLKGLFGMKKDKDPAENSTSGDRKNKNGQNVGHSGRGSTGLLHNHATIPPNITPAEVSWLKSNFFNDSDSEQTKHAIAVAAATAAAADAAVAAAQAAAEVVRLTSRANMLGGGRERTAAIKIQSLFRGYLSRKALRALRGLVKLQALVRGFLVRKQATATLHSMQALIRAQATVRAQRGSAFIRKDSERFQSLFRARKSMEKCDETRSEHATSVHSRRLSGTFDNAIDESPKIVEVDTGRPKSRSRRSNTWVSDCIDDPHSQTLSSPLPCRVPSRIWIPDCRNCQESDWGLTGDECRFSTAQSTPRFANSAGSNAPLTPSKSVFLDGFFRQCTNSPSYMASTQSFKAKSRSQSAPKQRPEAGQGSRKKLSLHDMMESRSSLSGVKMQRSCSQVQDVVTFKNAIMGKLDKSADLSKF